MSVTSRTRASVNTYKRIVKLKLGRMLRNCLKLFLSLLIGLPAKAGWSVNCAFGTIGYYCAALLLTWQQKLQITLSTARGGFFCARYNTNKGQSCQRSDEAYDCRTGD